MTVADELNDAIKTGNFNSINQVWLANGSCTVTLSTKQGKVLKGTVTKLYKKGQGVSDAVDITPV